MTAGQASVSCLSPLPVDRGTLLRLPGGACDCHFHIFDAPSSASLVAERDYTPPEASYRAYRETADQLGFTRGVLVQPSIYGTDNDLLTATLAQDRERLRGVAVVDAAVAASEIERLHAAGVRGVRVNLVNPGANRLEDLGPLGARIADHGWHIELQADLAALDTDAAKIAALAGVPVVLDHFSLLHGASPPAHIAALERALDSGTAWVKLSAPYRCTTEKLPYPGMAALARRLIAHHDDRLLWGSDWPHPGLTGDMPCDADLLDLVYDWQASETAVEKIFVRNPDQIYWAD